MAWNAPNKKAQFVIGVDCGVKTGLAIWDRNRKCFVHIATTQIHKAFEIVKHYHQNYDIMVRVEDARLRKWFGKAGAEQLQGAGSIKRDSGAWQDFLKDCGIPHEMVAPKNNKTKLSKEQFYNLTKYGGLTSEHSRDGAMLCFGY